MNHPQVIINKNGRELILSEGIIIYKGFARDFQKPKPTAEELLEEEEK